MIRTPEKTIEEILTKFRLAGLPCKADLKVLARRWGVISIDEQEIHSDAMLLPLEEGYRIILKRIGHSAHLGRQRFSLAHELGHLLLQKSDTTGVALKYRGHGFSDEEEHLCDQIAAEILMPRMAFYEDCWMEGWSLKSIKTLSDKYDTSISATARRMVDLMPEDSLMGVWKVSENGKEELQWPHAGSTKYRIPSPSILKGDSMNLVTRAWHSFRVEEGTAPVRLGNRRPIDVPAEAMSWGRDQYKQVMVFYYPTRQPTPSPV